MKEAKTASMCYIILCMVVSSAISLLFHSSPISLGTTAQLDALASRLLDRVNNRSPLRQGQKLYIKASSEYLPLVYELEKLAYKNYGSGFVGVRLLEPEFEKLKAKYGGQDFECHKKYELEMQKRGAASLDLTDGTDYYQMVGLSGLNKIRLKESISSEIDSVTKRISEPDTEEILDTCLGYKDGDPLCMIASRDHLHQALKVAEAAYKRGSKKIDIQIREELPQYDLRIPLVRYAPANVIKEDFYTKAWAQECIQLGAARLTFDGEHPYQFNDLDSKARQNLGVRGDAIRENCRDEIVKIGEELPWCMYYAPTPLSAKAAGYGSFREAVIDAVDITRKGKLKEHIAKIQKTRDQVNDLVEQGYDTVHYQSIDPITGQPDGKTDLRVGLTERSQFVCMGSQTHGSQKKYTSNVPSEEVFSTPHVAKTQGRLCATRPAYIDGMVIEGIELVFDKDGKVDLSQVKAKTNRDILINWLKQDDNARQLGEVSLVAGSPIFATGKMFGNVLLDENSTCHVALGSCYKRAIKGALEMESDEAEAVMRNIGCNVDLPMSKHCDIMIGNEHMKVSLESRKRTIPAKIVIENNKFALA